MNKTLLIILSSIFFLLFLIKAEASEKISNGLIEVIVNTEEGVFSIIDVRQNRTIISNSEIGFAIKPYKELWEVGKDDVETTEPAKYFKSSNAQNSSTTFSELKRAFPGGESLSLISTAEGTGQLEVQFTLYPDSTFVEMGFSFKNLGSSPVRLVKIDALKGKFLTDLNRKYLKTLNGDSGFKMTEVLHGDSCIAENNLLCFFDFPSENHSLVAGGLIYRDYRHFVHVKKDSITMFADDPVGKRVDAGTKYLSGDKFYLNGLVDNPFDALEYYAETSRKARNIDINYYTFPSVCMWFLSVTHFGGDPTAENSTVGAIDEMQNIVGSGFLKYAPVAVRLVPDCYEQNNQQGWWDDEHWQMHGRLYRCVVDSHYKKPYETTRKWAGKIQELGGIALTYFQPGIRSEDYAEAFPGHMLYNQSHKYVLKDGEIVGDPHVLMGTRGVPDLLNPGQRIPGYGKMWAESYDYTDPDFISHWKDVNQNLKDGGVEGVFYDYPRRAFPERGGLEDRYSTAANAYCNVFRIAREVQGPNAYIQERLGVGSDATLGFVSSVRTEGDNNIVTPKSIKKNASRWYKNRRLVNYDLDGKALLTTGYGENRTEITPVQRRAILTLSYVLSGRLLLTESFDNFSPEVIHDLSRIYPFHNTKLSARPLDIFINEIPSVFDFKISPNWHQLVLYNGDENSKEFNLPLNENSDIGKLELATNKSYYFYDFWNDNFIGILEGGKSLKQMVNSGEARMISIHAVENNPQWISTNRHVMQGYVEFVKTPEWDVSANTLSGIASVAGREPFKITVALNGYSPVKAQIDGANADIKIREDNPDLADLIINADENLDVSWTIHFKKQ